MKLVCGFSQRLQRPSFVRRTKHSGQGHEDMGYSYIVVRRGPRPSNPGTTVGRVGPIGRVALEKELESQIPVKELVLHSEPESARPGEELNSSVDEDPTEIQASEEPAIPAATRPVKELDSSVDEDSTEIQASEEPATPAALDAALRLEAYNWPRLIFPPLKKSGHIILDGCTPEGKSLI